MRTRWLKETRALLPVWAMAMLLSLTPLWTRPSTNQFLLLVCFGAGCVVLVVEAFGREFTHRTLEQWLSQPMSRQELWQEKISVVILGLALSAGIFGIALLVAFH